MLIAHIPAGYLMICAKYRKSPPAGVFWAGLLGSVAPDFDMLRFWFVDQGRFHHHSYATHKPLVWLGITLLALLFFKLRKQPFPKPALMFFAGIFLHLLLDSVAGDIRWLWPYSNQGFQLVQVTATHSHWILSFMAHWTFKLEILIWLVAITAFLAKSCR